jgi:hypothetical protein
MFNRMRAPKQHRHSPSHPSVQWGEPVRSPAEPLSPPATSLSPIPITLPVVRPAPEPAAMAEPVWVTH